MGGLHPVVAIYATFLNRAFDQVLMDVALHRLPVTFVLDRAGVTGPDGASHNGMWDGSILQVVPGLRIAAPRDGEPGRRAAQRGGRGQRRAHRGPLPQGQASAARSRPIGQLGGMDVLRAPGDGAGPDVLLVGAGPMALTCLEIADRLADHGIGVTVVDPRWVKPVDPALVDEARRAPAGGRGRGQRAGRRVRRRGGQAAARPRRATCRPGRSACRRSSSRTARATRSSTRSGLTPQHLARQITEAVAQRARAGG